MEKLAELGLELLKRLKPAYSAPVVLLLLFSWWRIKAFEEVRLRDIHTDPWIQVATILVGLWCAGYWYVRWKWFDAAKPTPEGKIGFFVARIEGDPGNKRQTEFMAKLHEEFDDDDLKKRMYIGDLRNILPHGSADAQAAFARELGRKANAVQVVWIVHGVGRTYVFHTEVDDAQEDTVPRAIGVPADSQIGRYFKTAALQYIHKPKKVRSSLIPNVFGRASKTANEASTVGKVRLIVTCAVGFQTGHPNIGYPNGLGEMGPGGDGCLDIKTAAGWGTGYSFVYRPTHQAGNINTGFEVVAIPTEYGATGIRSFYADDAGVIRFTAENRAATILDPPL